MEDIIRFPCPLVPPWCGQEYQGQRDGGQGTYPLALCVWAVAWQC